MTRLTSIFSVALGIGLVSSCGGGGGGDNSPPPPADQILQTTLVAAGSIASHIPALPSRVVRSQLELDEVFARTGLLVQDISEQYRAPDFSTLTLIYLEGGVDTDAGSAVRITELRRSISGSNTVDSEACSGPVANTTNHRAFAIYVVPPSVTAATFTSTARTLPLCLDVKKIDSTLIVAGDLPLSIPLLTGPTRVITSQAELAPILQRVPPSMLPVGFSPNFSAVTLIYLESGDIDPNSYIRLVGALENLDNSVDIGVELCGGFIVNGITHVPFALYSVPRITGATRFNLSGDEPPNCVVPR